MNLWIIFLTGLTVGGFTCLAVQGGLLASVIAVRENQSKKDATKHALYSTVTFLLAKLAGYTTIGVLLGIFGAAVSINGKVQAFIQGFAGIYMILVALNLLEVHPIFRYVVIQPPKMLTRLVRNQSKSKDIFAPLILGLMTVFIPCGTTIAMEALAIASANALTGGLIMAAFVLGTTPLFLGIGAFTTLLGESLKSKFLKFAAIGVIYLGLASINGSLVAFGSPVNFQVLAAKLSQPKVQYQEVPAMQNATINITSGGYSPNYLKVKSGKPVTLTLSSKGSYSCASAFRIPSLNISVNLNPDDTKTITFVPPKGKIQFSCSMGMYTGIIEAI